jgi:hypothetical protein
VLILFQDLQDLAILSALLGLDMAGFVA